VFKICEKYDHILTAEEKDILQRNFGTVAMSQILMFGTLILASY